MLQHGKRILFTYWKHILVGLAGVVLISWLIAHFGVSDHKIPAASVKVIHEEALNTVTLSPEAARVIGIAVKPMVNKIMHRMRLYSGEIITPIGKKGIVTSPVAGILKAPTDGIPSVGTTVKKGQTIFLLMPLLTTQARNTSFTAQVDAKAQVETSTAQFNIAKITLDRATRLYHDQVGSKRAVDEASAAYQIAEKNLDAAKARENLLSESLNEGTGGAIHIEAPEEGILRKVSAMRDQNVLGGAALFELGDSTTAWIRATVPVGDLPDIAFGVDATVSPLSAHVENQSQIAMAINGPPLANPQNFTVDLFYILHGSSTVSIPGERVSVMLPLSNSKESLTIPVSAIVYDVLGGTWVYQQVEAFTYARKRVILYYVLGEEAVLTEGPPPGSEIVITGAQQLFGAETGNLK